VRAHRGSDDLVFAVGRGEQRFEVQVPVEVRSGIDELGDVQQVGWIGIGNRRLPALLGVPSNESAAARAGLRSGDLVVAFDGVEIEDWEQLRRAYRDAQASALTVEVLRGEESQSFELPQFASLDALGVIAAAVLVDEVVADSAAAAAGLAAGDLLLEVDGQPVGSFESFAEQVRSSEGRVLAITFARAGAVDRVDVTPRLEKVPNPYGIEGMDQEFYRVGIAHHRPTLPGVIETERYSNPISALPRAVELTWDQTALFLRAFKKFFTGEVKSDQIAGPIGIAEIARKSLDLGWQVYLSTMVLISINLGVLNLLPIPILDGGQALIHLVEGVKRSPISLRSRELVQSFGLAMLALLMGVAFWNDVSRNWEKFVEWLRGGL
jgi:regulator of sigma E protease